MVAGVVAVVVVVVAAADVAGAGAVVAGTATCYVSIKKKRMLRKCIILPWLAVFRLALVMVFAGADFLG